MLQFVQIVVLQEQYTVIRANGDMMQIMDFLDCIVIWMGKSHIYCAKAIVFGRLLMMDCPKISLRHCLLGPFFCGQPRS